MTHNDEFHSWTDIKWEIYKELGVHINNTPSLCDTCNMIFKKVRIMIDQNGLFALLFFSIENGFGFVFVLCGKQPLSLRCTQKVVLLFLFLTRRHQLIPLALHFFFFRLFYQKSPESHACSIHLFSLFFFLVYG